MKNRYGELRSGCSLVIAVIAIFTGQLITSFLAGIMLVVFYAANNQDGSNSAMLLAEIFGSDALNALVMIVLYFIMTGMVIGVFKLIYKRPVSEMGLSKRRFIKELLYGGLLAVALMGIVFFALLISGQMSIEKVDFSQVATFGFVVNLIQFILVGFFEEIFGRGFIMTAMKTTRNKYVIIFSSAIIFSAMHITNPNVTFISLVNIFLAGVLFSMLFIKTGRLWTSIGFHIAWNFFQGCVFGMNVSGTKTESIVDSMFTGNDFVTGGEFGAEGGVVVTIVLLAGLGFVQHVMKAPDAKDWTITSNMPLTRGALNKEDENAITEESV